MRNLKKLTSYENLLSFLDSKVPRIVSTNILFCKYKIKIEDIHRNHHEILIDFQDLENDLKMINNGYPWQYLYKKCFFNNEYLSIEEPILIPRPETINLIKITNNYILNKKLNILEIGTGSGVIPRNLSLGKNSYIGIDISKKAYKISRQNNPTLKFKNIGFEKLLTKKITKFDLIISNPPYINKNSESYIYNKYEDRKALFSNKDGFDMIFKIINNFDNLLNNKGRIILEIGFDQKEKLENFLKENNFNFIFYEDDWQNIRNVILWKK